MDQYSGRLTTNQIAAGMNAAKQNARRLAADAKLLLEADRFPSAASLAILSIEESGKETIFRSLALARTPKELASYWKDYRTHTKKNVTWVLPDLVKGGARTLDELAPIFDSSSDHAKVLDHVKQLGFYTDCLGQAHWSVPSEVIDKSLAASLVETAEIFASDRQIIVEEVGLWIEHIGPVWGGPVEWMKTALVGWHRAMIELGVDIKGDAEAFIRDRSRRD